MYNLVNTNFSRTYNPIGNRNALTDIKRLLTSRDIAGQTKACGYLLEVVKRYHINSEERTRMIEYLLENDIVVFLCEAISNLSFPLFRLVLECIRLLWNDRRFFVEEHAANTMAAVLRSLSHYSATNTAIAVDSCLHFLCDLLNGICTFQAISALSHQSPCSVDQLFACLHDLATRICGNSKTILSSALVLLALITYQPSDLDLRATVVNKLFEVTNQWFNLLLGSMKHKVLMEDNEEFGMFLVVISQIGIDTLRLLKVLNTEKPSNFVQTILTDEQEVATLKLCMDQMRCNVVQNICGIVVLVKDNQEKINNEEYSVFLKFILTFLLENPKSDTTEFCDVLITSGYLTMLPQYQILRNDKIVRKISTLILGEMLKILTEKYLIGPMDTEKYAADIQMGLVELQHGIEQPENIGIQLQKSQPYSLLIYIYFYCQSADKPEQCTANLLPHLADHVLSLPQSLKPPLYIIKALWLVFAMCTVCNGTIESLDERVKLERATSRVVSLVQAQAAPLYTHHPALLLWAFTSLRIPYSLRLIVLSQWLTTENTLPEDLSKDSMVWELLLNVLMQNTNEATLTNCMDALHFCLDNDDGTRQDLVNHAWSMLPGVLSRSLIDSDNVINPNICYLLDIATSQLPATLEQPDCLKIAVLITTLFSKNNPDSMEMESRCRYEYAALKLCLMLLQISNEGNDDKVLLTFVNRVGFLPSVLSATESVNDEVACSALQLLSHTVIYFTKNKYQAKTTLQIQTDSIIKSLRRDSANDRGVCLLHLLYVVLSSAYTPLVFTYQIKILPSLEQQCDALRALLFRVQLILCCQNMDNQSPMGWKAINSIFKHAIVYKNDPNLVATLSTQPWTFTLIRFQLTQNPTKEFISFTHNWLTLLRITISKRKAVKSVFISKYSLIKRTLVTIKKTLKEEENEDCIKVVTVTNEILSDCSSEKQ